MVSKMNQPTPIAIAVVRRGDSFLVGERSLDGPLPGLAEFPGGKCLPGERAAEAAVRECREETGLEVRAVVTLQEVEHAYAHGRLRLSFVACEVDGMEAARPPFRWVPRSQLSSLRFPDANRELIRMLTEGTASA